MELAYIMGRSSVQLLINLVASIVNFAVSIGIGLFLTPFIVKEIGADAFGFVGLANNMANYAQIITVALNSVAGRFIAVAYHKNKKEEAKRLYSSTIAADVVLTIILSVVGVFVVLNLENLIVVPDSLLTDVKLLFTFIFLNFSLTTLSTAFTVSTFVKNKLYLSNIINILSSVLRILIIVILFGFFSPKVFYVGLSLVPMAALTLVLNYFYTLRLTPELRFRRDAISMNLTFTMISSGIWNTIIKIQQTLSTGLNLLVANVMISPLHMGILSIAQTIPNTLSSLMYMISSLFYPVQTQLYAQGKKRPLLRELKAGMRISGFFTNIIFVALIVDGLDFIILWQPNQDSIFIYRLMILTMFGFFLSGVATTLQNLPMIVDRLKYYSLFWLFIGILTIVTTLIAVKYTNYGVYAVAFVPTFYDFIANLTIVPIYASSCLKIRYSYFYFIYLQYTVSTFFSVIVSFLIKISFVPQSLNWGTLFLSISISSFVTIFFDFVILFGDYERKLFLSKVLRKK